jgi:ketosteroid isomerase-like protein
MRGMSKPAAAGGGDPSVAAITPPRREPWTPSHRAAYILPIADERGSESERLARRYFALFEEGDLTQLLELMHPDIELVVKSTRPGEVLRGRAAVAALAREQIERLFESTAEVFEPLDETRIVVEGRIRWLDDDRVLRDDPMVWALEFSDGLLLRSTPAHSVLEAKMILAAREDG